MTENGIATSDDTRRVAFIDAALNGVAACIRDGLPVKSYLHWSLLDNFEWQKGYSMTFGLIAVDRTTQTRPARRKACVSSLEAIGTAKERKPAWTSKNVSLFFRKWYNVNTRFTSGDMIRILLLETNCPAELMLPDIISMLGFSSLVLAISNGNRMPLILDTEFGLIWIAGFEYRGFELKQIHIMGPAFTGSSSHLILRKKLDSYQLTVKLRSKIVRQIVRVCQSFRLPCCSPMP